MRRRPAAARPLAAACCAVLTVVLSACGPDDVTRPRLEAAVSTTFANLFVRQQALLGRPGVGAEAVAARASCTRPGTAPGAAPHGAGEWRCALRWTAVDGMPTTAAYDVQARAGGCFTATGPESVVGPPSITGPDGTAVVNPVAAFDGCFDPS